MLFRSGGHLRSSRHNKRSLFIRYNEHTHPYGRGAQRNRKGRRTLEKQEQNSICREIGARTGGDIYIGVVGPVRSGKSTFIKYLKKHSKKRIRLVAPTAIAALNRLSPIRSMVASTYQAVSGAGVAGIGELHDQISALEAGRMPTVSAFPHQIAYNLIPQIGGTQYERAVAG